MTAAQEVLFDLGGEGARFLFESRVVGEVLKAAKAELIAGLIHERILSISPATLRQFAQHIETGQNFKLLFKL